MTHTVQIGALLLLTAAGQGVVAAECQFVVDGVPKHVQTVGQPWGQEGEYLTCEGTGNFLYAPQRLGPGDFVVTARLRIRKLAKSAASLVVNSSHFGFEGGGGEMFTEGPLFGTRNLGTPIVKEDQPFSLVMRRTGNQLAIEVDGRQVLTTTTLANSTVRVGLRPWRSTMQVAQFSATGNLLDPPVPLPHVTVFESGQEGYHTFRIPAIVVSTKGTLLAFCEGRKSSRSDAGDIDMLVRRSTDAGKTWSDPIVVWDDDNNTCGNPCPVVDQETGVIWLPMTWNLGSDHESKIMDGTSQDVRHVFVTSSADDGLTWSTPVKISDSARKAHWRWYATGPGNAIQLTRGPHKGRMLIPANHSDHTDPAKHPYRSHAFWSDDHGQTWHLGGITDERTNESAAVELADGSVLLSMRSYHGKHNRAAAISRDGGAHFGPTYLDDALQTPVCQGSIIRCTWPNSDGRDERDGRGRILYSGPAGTDRTELTVYLSYDEGKTWPIHKLIYEGGSAYSNLVMLPDGRIGVLYEKDDYQTISLVTFTLDWLEASER